MDLTVTALMAVRQLGIQTEMTTRVIRKLLDTQQMQAQALNSLLSSQGVGSNLNLLG